ncbi:hypothetical protein [Oscillatoria sp. FACHB-1406]|uniref:WD40 domain-containing protein n=1 Tax=Oscillatoria sp. FACHB-1406 TaxID=2692846 RepID=UPI001681DD0B|nr:hypothetical protein [Oscillatoria sp. FACHB-1406]MBD2576287.1 hypothetical protein [Oscillatoria sp. FACHB-1406]
MCTTNPPHLVSQSNDRSLSILARAILLGRYQFALILVRCNYERLQRQMWQGLQQELRSQSEAEVRLREIRFSSSTPALFDTLLSVVEAEIAAQPEEAAPQPSRRCNLDALMVFGLESAEDLERVLADTNQVREEFRKHFTCPVVLWATDEVLQKMTRFAPDFKSWASAAIKFEQAIEDSIQLWWEIVARLFRELLDSGAKRFVSNAELGLAPGSRDRRELECARLEVLAAHIELSEMVEAIWAFILGRDAYNEGRIQEALEQYQRSLEFWGQGSEDRVANAVPSAPNIANPFLEQKGLLLYHLGLCYCYEAREHPNRSRQCATQARLCFSDSLEIFTLKERPEAIANLTVQLGQVLQQLEYWHELQALARGALTQSTIYHTPEVRARAYGFLARGALARGNPEAARILALKALGIHERASTANSLGEALYSYLLARSQYELGQTMEAIALLERARSAIAPKTIASEGEVQPTTEKETLYLEILEMLRSLYFQQHQYELAFTLKQEQQRVEQACGLRAFYGLSSPTGEGDRLPSYYPTEILAFGRQRDVEALLERVRRSEHKLTILHGPSGAGKSSLLHAGLVPALWDEIIAAREILPAIQTTYNDWQQGLSRAFSRSLTLRERKLGQPQTLPDLLSPAAILDFLQSSSQGNLLVVIVFDQFEEFFYNCPQREDRRAFYRFLCDSLSIPFVKVILCLREDCLHELLAMEREMDWGIVDNDLLDRQVRYALADLSLEAAAGVVKRLTERSHFHLENDLIERFVCDLADSQQTIRPIELQVVGSALQAEKITLLQEYRQLGSNPKTILVERWLQSAIADCGPENEEVVWQVLYALTDSQGLRLLKTQAELARAVRSERTRKQRSETLPSPPLTSILKILVGSGLVSRLREESDERYQLVHGYLVGRIRQQYSDRTSRAIATQLSGSKAEVTRARKQRLHALTIGGICALFALSAVYLSLQTETQRRLATIVSRNAELMALSASSEALFASNQEFEALLEGLRAVKQLKAEPPIRQKPSLQALHLPTDTATDIKTDTRLKVLTVLEQALYGTLERNRLEGHSDVVWGVCFSPDGQRIATASLDRTVKVWHPDGRLLTTLFGHRDSVTSVDISRDGSIASSSWDGTVRLWNVDGTPDLAIQAHRGRVYSVRFSRDGEMLASAGADGMVKIWSRQGRLLQTLSGHRGEVSWASFSPDGSEIASVGQDGTLRLWKIGGQVVKVVRAHQEAANYVVFSPKGDVLATAGEDRAVKLWSRDGRLLRVLSGHQGSVHAIAFSPDGQRLASASNDNTIALWNRQGRLSSVLKGHSDRVTGVGFSPDGLTLVSSSFDKTIKLWTLQKRSRVVLRGHRDRVLDVVFSPDGDIVATASKDKTAKLWTRQGQLLATLSGHRDSVLAVAFSPDGERVATASKDKSVKVWTRRGQLLQTLSGHGDWVLDVEWSPDGQWLATASRDKTVKLWSREGKLRQTLSGHRDRVNAVAFNADGSLLASASDDRTIKLWRFHRKLRSGRPEDGAFDPQPLSTLKGHSNWVLDVTFLPPRADGRASPLLASASYDNTVKFWSDREMLYTLKGHTDSVAHLSFNPTGEILATTTWSSEVQLWRLDDTLLKTLEGHSDRATSVAWSQDGNALATASEDKTAIIWNFDEEQLAKNACDWLRNYIHNSNEVRRSDRQLCTS